MSSSGLLERPGCAKVNRRPTSHRKEREEKNQYVPKTLKHRDLGLVGDSSQSQMDYSSHVVDPTQAHEYAGYAGGF